MKPFTQITPAISSIVFYLVMLLPPACTCNRANDTGTDINMETSVKKQPMEPDGIVRLSSIEVYPEYLDEYITYATEVGTISLQTEPGVLTMYAVADKRNPCLITILETYASQEAYQKHIGSDHFRKYKQSTLHMVKSLRLDDVTPLNPASRITNLITPE